MTVVGGGRENSAVSGCVIPTHELHRTSVRLTLLRLVGTMDQAR